MSKVCARCQTPTKEPVVVAVGHGASAGGGTVYACPGCAPTFPKQRDPFHGRLMSSYRRTGQTR
ncbi:hypothetical protein [Streptomyces sp. NPDC019937]|uniref:hypothetical protein n=1 Tax=Streptomyces sp. NPDC019937 TaxID=3154787 RepID=UPI0033D28FC4